MGKLRRNRALLSDEQLHTSCAAQELFILLIYTTLICDLCYLLALAFHRLEPE